MMDPPLVGYEKSPRDFIGKNKIAKTTTFFFSKSGATSRRFSTENLVKKKKKATLLFSVEISV